jgi:hypothetical protein
MSLIIVLVILLIICLSIRNTSIKKYDNDDETFCYIIMDDLSHRWHHKD